MKRNLIFDNKEYLSMNKLSRFKYSEEAISFQNRNLFNLIAEVFDEYFLKDIVNVNRLKELDLDNIVFKHSGIKVRTFLVPFTNNFCISSPKITPNLAIINHDRKDADWKSKRWMTNGLEITRNKSVVNGFVDIKNSKVGGVFSEIVCSVLIDPILIKQKKLTSKECAAIYLHELGHAFTAFEFLIETVTTNQFLSSVTKELLEMSDQNERVIFLGKVEKELNAVIQDKEALSKTEDANTLYAVLINDRVDYLRSSTDTSVYDYKSWEFLADQFAVRHGAAKYLASSISKLGDTNRDSVDRLGIFAFQVLGLSALTIWVPGIGILASLWFIFKDFEFKNKSHDDTEQRLRRMRNDLTQYIKNPNIDSELKDVTINEITVIDDLLKSIEDTRPVMEAFWDFVRPARRDAKKQYDFQVKMEKLAGNSLFVHAAKLSTLTRQ